MKDITITDKSLFDCRPPRTEACPRCQGQGSVSVGYGYALHPSRDPINGAPPGAIYTLMAVSFDVFSAAKEAATLAARASRPVAFKCLDYVVIINPGDDPDQIARTWRLQQYRETPEATRARR